VPAPQISRVLHIFVLRVLLLLSSWVGYVIVFCYFDVPQSTKNTYYEILFCTLYYRGWP